VFKGTLDLDYTHLSSKEIDEITSLASPVLCDRYLFVGVDLRSQLMDHECECYESMMSPQGSVSCRHLKKIESKITGPWRTCTRHDARQLAKHQDDEWKILLKLENI